MPTNYRVPRGFAVRHPAFQELYEGQRPTIKDLKPAPYLPVAEIEPRHDDPIVLPAGTWVGIINADHTYDSNTGHVSQLNKYLVPAFGQVYKLEYTANDVSSTFGTLGNVPSLDSWVNAAKTGASVAAAGTTTASLGKTGVGVKPVGIVFHDCLASWLPDAYINYTRQETVSLLTRDYVVSIPAVTPAEKLIEPGDLVAVDGHVTGVTNTWSPGQSNTGQYTVGRLVALKNVRMTGDTGSVTGLYGLFNETQKVQEFVVGRCLRKVLVAHYSSATPNTLLSANTSAISRTNVSVEFQDAGRVQTVPGLSLQGSGIKGVPAWSRTATADANGKFWLLEIHVGVC